MKQAFMMDISNSYSQILIQIHTNELQPGASCFI